MSKPTVVAKHSSFYRFHFKVRFNILYINDFIMFVILALHITLGQRFLS